MTNVMIGMSGGVDSSVAAWLLLQQGFKCRGCTMSLFQKEGDSSAEDAQAVADRLGIPLLIEDFSEIFRQEVMEVFAATYEAGQTPNPCIRCNRMLKFGAMLDFALAQGCDAVATGHYARIRRDESTGRYLLYKAKDAAKDQTYFLYCLTQQQLSHTLFPLGELTKEEVRQIAQAQGFLNARKRDSQDICFIPDGDYAAFLERYRQRPLYPGSYLDRGGRVIGTHRGAAAYTIGQRKGLGIALGAPAYVCGKDMAANTVTLGPNEALFTASLTARDMNWIPFPALTAPMAVTAKIRHSQKTVEATVYPLEGNRARVEFREPQRAITPGQAVVLYQGELVIGGGTIE